MYRSWRMDPSGLVIVTLADGTERTPTLHSPKLIDVAVYIRDRWGTLFFNIGTEIGVDDLWLRAHCLRESEGDDRARNPEGTPDKSNDGIGLFQITYPGLKGRHQVTQPDGHKIWVGGYTDEELFEPERNTRIACRHIRSLVNIYGPDFPKNSAAFNAGSVHKPYPGFENNWGMHCTPGHIDVEVSALNWYILDVMKTAEQAVALQFPLIDLIDAEPAIVPTIPAPPDDPVA